MREVKVADTSILLVRLDDRFHALNAACTHYGAPLAEGALRDGRIVCPWHHACFNATSGDLLEPPALDALRCADVTLEGDDVIVTLTDDWSDRREPSMAPRDLNDSSLYVVIGGGAAGYMASQTLREDGFGGRILVLSSDTRQPYDRPNLSKDYLRGTAGDEWMPLRPEAFFREHGIDIQVKTRVDSLDAATKSIVLADGSRVTYDKAVVATGGVPRSLDVAGSDLANIFLLRSHDDADDVIAALMNAKRAIVIGASFIGMEAACSLRLRDIDVTVIAPDNVPFARTLGEEIGGMFRTLHEEHGVHFRMQRSVVRFEGNKAVSQVVLDNGERLEADIVIIGVGVRPAASFVHNVELDKDGAIVVDEYLRAADSLYAAGDIASFIDPRAGRRSRIEHWRAAEQQARIAAHNMCGREIAYASVPFFWTQQFDQSLRYVGHATSVDDIVIEGDVAARDFIAYYCEGDRIAAVAGMQRDHRLAEIEALMQAGAMADASDIRAANALKADGTK